MECIHCHQLIPETAAFCPACGQKLAVNTAAKPEEDGRTVGEESPVISDENSMGAAAAVPPSPPPIYGAPAAAYGVPGGFSYPVAPPRRRHTGLIIVAIVAVAAVLLAGGGFLLWHMQGKADLHRQLMRGWSRVEESRDSYYDLVLDFSEDTLDYRFESFYINETIRSYDYTVVSPSKVEIDGTTYTIEFNDEKSMMTMTPSLTSVGSSENWFHH